jgi:hypothetical protein
MDSELKAHVPEFFLEQEALGEYQGDRDLSAHSEKIAGLQNQNKAFLERFPAALYLRRAKEQSRTDNQEEQNTQGGKSESFLSRFYRWFQRPWRRLSLVGALLTMIFLPLAFMNFQQPYTGIKGSGAPSLQIYLKTQEQPLSLEAGASLSEGDLVQLSYTARGKTQGLIVSLDGRGNTYLHLSQGQKSATLLQNGAVNLPYSYELDDAPEFERFVFYTSDEPFDYSTVEAHLRQGDALPSGISSTEISLVKE